ncbi:hypothetical protein BJ165DRAFT_1616369 [Panaeolus papilionaceus]|nr:hypothetical protein BJ165DRAFT_1616369 [Panaeolus papilionaceus]
MHEKSPSPSPWVNRIRVRMHLGAPKTAEERYPVTTKSAWKMWRDEWKLGLHDKKRQYVSEELKTLLLLDPATLLLLQALLMCALGLWFWRKPETFNGEMDPNGVTCVSIFILGRRVPLSSVDFRLFSLVLYCLLLINCSVGAILVCLSPDSAVAAFYYQNWSSTRHKVASKLSQWTKIHHPELFLFHLIVNLGLIIHIETTLQINRVFQTPDESTWTFGQTLAVLVLLPSIQDVIKRLVIQPYVKPRGRRETNLLQNDISVGHVGGFVQRIKKGADVNVIMSVGASEYATALHAAPWKGETEVVSQLLIRNADVNIQGQGTQWVTALQAASFGGHGDIVNMLLMADADTKIVGGIYGTALGAAASKGHLDIVRRLLEGDADCNSQGGKYGTALQAASHGGHYKVVELLLDEGADTNGAGGQYRTALQAAAYPPERRALSDKDGDPEDPDTKSQPVPDSSASRTFVIGREAKPNERRASSDNGENHEHPDTTSEPVAEPTASSTFGVVSLLLDHKADPNIEGMSPHMMKEWDPYDLLSPLGGEFGSALQAACYCAATDIVRLLLEKEADPAISVGKLGTPLSICGRRKVEMEAFGELVAEYEAIEVLLSEKITKGKPW